MSGGLDAFALGEEDVKKFLACSTHLGAQNVDFQMEQYVFKRKPDGVHIINLRKTWEKLLLAARAIVAIKNPADVCVISARPYGQRAVLKFARATRATPIVGRFIPGTFTNHIQSTFREPRLLVVTDPRTDHQPVTEASYVNIPVIALCNTDSPLRYVDIAIPCNNKGIQSIGLMWWLLAREVLRLRGFLSLERQWCVKVDGYFYRGPEEAEKEEQTAIAEKAVAKEPTDQWAPEAVPQIPQQTEVTDWAAETMSTQPAIGGQFMGSSLPASTEDWSKPVPPIKGTAAKRQPLDNWAGDDEDNWSATDDSSKQVSGMKGTAVKRQSLYNWGGDDEDYW